MGNPVRSGLAARDFDQRNRISWRSPITQPVPRSVATDGRPAFELQHIIYIQYIQLFASVVYALLRAGSAVGSPLPSHARHDDGRARLLRPRYGSRPEYGRLM